MPDEIQRTPIVIGHKNPDTDSICSAICYANLKTRATGTVSYTHLDVYKRQVNALGQPIDGKGPIETSKFRRIEPVSYTHLDVYKRQHPVLCHMQWRFSGLSAELFS